MGQRKVVVVIKQKYQELMEKINKAVIQDVGIMVNPIFQTMFRTLQAGDMRVRKKRYKKREDTEEKGL